MKSVISVIIPCRNEARYIGLALDSLLSQKVEGEVEILIADGMSDDGTREVLRSYERNHPQIRVFDNPKRTVPYALEILLSNVKGECIVRVDAHCEYPGNYLLSLTETLVKSGADNVGGVWDTVPGSSSIRASIIAGCLNSPFGVGISYRTRKGHTPVSVETVPFGAWRANHFEKYGPFDEDFTRAQDLEHNIRVVKAGGKILCLPWLKVKYFARDTFPKLRKMAVQYGYWKIPVMLKHRTRFSLRQFIPAALVLGSGFSLIAGTINPLGLIPIGLYGAANLFASISTAYKDRLLRYFPLYMYTFALIHYGYGLGYLRGVWDACLGRQKACTGLSR